MVACHQPCVYLGFLYNWFVFAILDNAIIELQLLTLWFNKLLAGVIWGFLEGTAKEFFEKLCFTKIGRTGSYMPMVLGFFYLRVPNRGCHKVPRNAYCFHGINTVGVMMHPQLSNFLMLLIRTAKESFFDAFIKCGLGQSNHFRQLVLSNI